MNRHNTINLLIAVLTIVASSSVTGATEPASRRFVQVVDAECCRHGISCWNGEPCISSAQLEPLAAAAVLPPRVALENRTVHLETRPCCGPNRMGCDPVCPDVAPFGVDVPSTAAAAPPPTTSEVIPPGTTIAECCGKGRHCGPVCDLPAPSVSVAECCGKGNKCSPFCDELLPVVTMAECCGKGNKCAPVCDMPAPSEHPTPSSLAVTIADCCGKGNRCGPICDLPAPSMTFADCCGKGLPCGLVCSAPAPAVSIADCCGKGNECSKFCANPVPAQMVARAAAAAAAAAASLAVPTREFAVVADECCVHGLSCATGELCVRASRAPTHATSLRQLRFVEVETSGCCRHGVSCRGGGPCVDEALAPPATADAGRCCVAGVGCGDCTGFANREIVV